MSCSSHKYAKTPAITQENTINAVIEIPAGTNKKIEFEEATSQFKIDSRNGEERIIQYLPYIGNYGYVPNTKTKIEQDGDGDAVDILVIAEHTKTGKIVATIPIGLLKLVDNKQLDYKVIAVPVTTKDNLLRVNSYKELHKNYPSIQKIIEEWFTHYDTVDHQEIVGWGDEKEAVAYIKANLK